MGRKGNRGGDSSSMGKRRGKMAMRRNIHETQEKGELRSNGRMDRERQRKNNCKISGVQRRNDGIRRSMEGEREERKSKESMKRRRERNDRMARRK